MAAKLRTALEDVPAATLVTPERLTAPLVTSVVKRAASKPPALLTPTLVVKGAPYPTITLERATLLLTRLPAAWP